MKTRIEEALGYIGKHIKNQPKILLVLGSGLSALAEETLETILIPYKDIPNFPISTAPGHKSRLRSGKLAGCELVIMEGRFHYYEGYSMDDIAFPVRLMKRLGVEKLVLTNAAGGINRTFRPGDLMLIHDHINMTGQNPLIGKNDDAYGPRFPDMSRLYDKNLNEIILNTAKNMSVDLKTGVYAFMSGPSFETPAEIRMLEILGADAVGMSTVPEAVCAGHAGMKVAGISCISNMAAGILDQPITEQEVLETGLMVKEKFSALLKGFLPLI